MLNTAINGTANISRVDLTLASIDRPQPVSVVINGFEFPGEVIFADQWQAWFGSSLPERTMFRLVLLSENQRVDPGDITVNFVAVAVPSAEELEQYSDEFTQLSRELGRLNEIREQYVVSTDNGLNSLTASLKDTASKAQRSITEVLANRWRGGRVITVARGDTVPVRADSIFVGEEPIAWIEAVAATMFTHRVPGANGTDSQFDPENVFARMLESDERAWRTSLDARIGMAVGVGFERIAKEIDSIAADSPDNKVDGPGLRGLLLEECGFPPGLASLILVAYIKIHNGEASFTSNTSGLHARLDSHSLSTAVYDPELIYEAEWLSSRHIGDWNSALSYTRVLLPNAASAESGEPSEDAAQQFMQTLELTAARNTLTLHTLENMSGPAIGTLPAVEIAQRLAPALESEGWREFYERAREMFPSVVEFMDAFAESSRLRVLSEDIVDIQAAHDYLATADFGRIDQGLASEAAILLETVNVSTVLERGMSASVELEKFQRWKQRFTRAYLDHHADRRSADMELARRVKSADAHLNTVERLATVPELRDIYNSRFRGEWEELKELVEPCRNSEHQVSLQRQPYCIDCGVRLGSSGYADEVEARISEIEEMLRESCNRLSNIATSRVLTGQREAEWRKLIDVISIADLTALSNVLDDRMLIFIKRFASDSPSEATSSA